jgi:ABC-type branched-subunit amino acid transport system ATPase component
MPFRAAKIANWTRRLLKNPSGATKSASARSCEIVVKAAAISRLVLALRTWICSPITPVAFSIMTDLVAICRGLINDPKLLLMDEPFSAFDAISRDEMNAALAELWDRYHKTAIFITHSIREAVYLADRVLVMSPRPCSVWPATPDGDAGNRGIHRDLRLAQA